MKSKWIKHNIIIPELETVFGKGIITNVWVERHYGNTLGVPNFDMKSLNIDISFVELILELVNGNKIKIFSSDYTYISKVNFTRK